MTRIVLIMTIGVAALLLTPARLDAQQPSERAAAYAPQSSAAIPTQGHDHRVVQSPAAKPDIDALVAKMNAANGSAKIDAMAEVLTALVQNQKDCEAKMAGMMSGMGGHPAKQPESPSTAP